MSGRKYLTLAACDYQRDYLSLGGRYHDFKTELTSVYTRHSVNHAKNICVQLSQNDVCFTQCHFLQSLT